MILFRRGVVVLLAVVSVVAACGDDPAVVAGGDPVPTTISGVPLPEGAPVTVFAVDVAGGFVPVETALGQSASLVVLSDGTVRRPAPVPAIHPGPALPALETTVLSAGELDRVLAQVAESAGLFGGVDFGIPGVTDLPGTTVTAWLAGAPVEAYAYALDFGDDVGLDAEQVARRAELRSLIADVAAAVDGAAAGWGVADPPALQVHSLGPPPASDIDPGEPRAFPVAASGLVSADGHGCLDVDPADLPAVLDAAATATQLTPWVVDDQTVALVFRAVHPHDGPCR